MTTAPWMRQRRILIELGNTRGNVTVATAEILQDGLTANGTRIPDDVLQTELASLMAEGLVSVTSIGGRRYFELTRVGRDVVAEVARQIAWQYTTAHQDAQDCPAFPALDQLHVNFQALRPGHDASGEPA